MARTPLSEVCLGKGGRAWRVVLRLHSVDEVALWRVRADGTDVRVRRWTSLEGGGRGFFQQMERELRAEGFCALQSVEPEAKGTKG